MSFWLWAGICIAAAAAFVIYPLVRRSRQQLVGTDRAAMVRALYRDRLAELDGEVELGQLAPEARDAVAEEMGAALLADYPADAAVPGAEHDPPAPGLAVLVAGVLVLASVAIYWQVGEPSGHTIVGAEAVMGLDARTQSAELEVWQGRLASRVAVKPEDAQSWYLLGHARLQLQRYPQAAEAFAMAHAVVGDDPNIDVYWLQARYLAAQGVIDGGTRAIAERLLAARPNHPLVLELFAIDAYRRGEYRPAVDFLSRALAGPLSPAQRASLSTSLEQARAQMGVLVPSIDLQIRTLQTPPPHATLFVIARPPGGGMPYAVVRRPSASFPIMVRLDDAVAMNPARPLSAAEEIQVVVRLSLDGGAQAQPGDWQWQSEPIGVAALDVPLTFAVELAAPEKS